MGSKEGPPPYPVVLLAPTDDEARVNVAGPQDARPVRELPAGRVLDLLEASRSMATREAASFLAREFSRLEETVVPGLRVKDLLTPHFLRERLRWPINEQRLLRAVEGVTTTGSVAWRSLFQGMGYQVEQLPQRGYLLRHDNAPIAVVHPHRDVFQFSRLTDNGALPEGMVLADCGCYGLPCGLTIRQIGCVDVGLPVSRATNLISGLRWQGRTSYGHWRSRRGWRIRTARRW